MKKTEYDYYNELANWSFEDIDSVSETLTNWIYEDEIKKRVTKNSKILDLGTAAGEKVLKKFPDCAEILGTDFSVEMIENANKNLKESGREHISFRVMDNLAMDTPDDYFDLVTARHTPIAPEQIHKTLKQNGYLVVRGVDMHDCWALKRLFGRGQGTSDKSPISIRDYEEILAAGFKDVEMIPLHVVDYYKTPDDLYALLVKTPILNDVSGENSNNYEHLPIEKELFDQYVSENTTEKGIRLIRRYYGITARK